MAAKRRFGAERVSWIDMSTGINPVPWPGVARVEIDWQRLPEPGELQRLEEAAANSFGLDARYVCAVPGSEAGLRLAGALIGGEAQHVSPGYRTHGRMIAGSEAVTWDDSGERDGTVVLANPNNPDGRIIDPATLLTLLRTRGEGSWLLVDEAFVDFDPARSMSAHVREDVPLLVFRSFGKFFGLAGVRLGFVLGPAGFLAQLRAMVGAWPVSAAAAAIGTAAYADENWIAATRLRLPLQAASLDDVLERAGYRIAGECPLFRLIETRNADALFRRLARHGILSRPFEDQPHWLRLGLPCDETALMRLKAALADG